MRKILLFIARALFSLIFVVAGVSKFFSWQGTVQSLTGMLRDWQIYFETSGQMADIIERLVAFAPLLVGCAAAFEIIGGLLVFLNIRMRIGALLLLLFLIPTTLIYHAFWLEIGEAYHVQMSMFLKNVTIIGALFVFLIGAPSNRPSKKLFSKL